MPFVQQAIASAKESTICPEGLHDLRCVKAELVRNKADTRNLIKVLLAVDDEDDVLPVTHYLNMTDADDEYANMHLLNQKRFFVCFGVPHEDDGFDPDDIVECTANCMVRHSPNDEDPERPFTRIDPPPLSDEDATAETGGKSKRRRAAS
jgi:hypothetical protein